MADKLKNVTGLFKEGRTRVIVLTTLVTLLIAIIVGLFGLRGRATATDGGAGVAQAPEGIQSVPFSAPTDEYAKLQEQQNAQQAKQAEAVGGSAIPTIVRAENTPISDENQGDAGIGFTALSREQTDAGVFNPKTLNLQTNKSQPNCIVVAGTPVYDKNGKLIGTVGPDGKVRDLNGKIIGSVDPDGTVRDQKGNVLGKVINASGVALGTPVYDDNGRLIGYAGPDGKVRDLNGKIIGTLGPDGFVRDMTGKGIGKIASAISGTPVYDANGKLIGYVGPDGKVRDINGSVIGTVGPDGKIRDASGKILGSVGTPVYDDNGNLIGYAGPDGKVRDLNGNVIGTIGPDGKVRDTAGKIIGALGLPAYDKNGKLIGYAGPDGMVRDLNGNIIGTAGPNGEVQNLQKQVLGGTGNATKGEAAGIPIYDKNGKLIGYAGSDGTVRDLNGNIIGTVGPDGVARDPQGQMLGEVGKSASEISGLEDGDNGNASSSSLNPSPEVTLAQNQNASADEVFARQQQIMKDQNLQQMMQQKQQAMSTQASQLMVAWASPVQQFVPGDASDSSSNGGSGGPSGQDGASGNASSQTGGASATPLMKAGTIFYAVINTAVNSDQPGPIMATIVSGDYKGAKLLGTLTNQGQAVMLTFNAMTMDSFPKSLSVNAVAIDQNTARTALSTYTDNHYLLRYGSMFAAAFAQGYGQAFQQAGSQTSTSGLITTTTAPNLSGSGKFYVALGNVGTQFSSQLGTVFSTPPTVYVASGTAIGVLFLGDVQMPS